MLRTRHSVGSGRQEATGGRAVTVGRLGTLALAAAPVLAAVLGGCTDWRGDLAQELPEMGHRNWVVVVDSAYPAQTAGGIKTVTTRAGQLEVVRAVLQAVDDAPHVRGVVYLDSELKYVSEKDAPGITAYRKSVDALLKKRGAMSVPHEELIAKLDEAAKTFRVLILKTDFALPYTSVFVQLDCGYWGAAQEKRLRQAISAAASAAATAPSVPAKPPKDK